MFDNDGFHCSFLSKGGSGVPLSGSGNNAAIVCFVVSFSHASHKPVLFDVYAKQASETHNVALELYSHCQKHVGQ